MPSANRTVKGIDVAFDWTFVLGVAHYEVTSPKAMQGKVIVGTNASNQDIVDAIVKDLKQRLP